MTLHEGRCYRVKQSDITFNLTQLFFSTLVQIIEYVAICVQYPCKIFDKMYFLRFTSCIMYIYSAWGSVDIDRLLGLIAYC